MGIQMRVEFSPRMELCFSEERREMSPGDLRSKLPLETVLPSETISPPESENVSADSVFHLDAFLYDDELEQRLVEEGAIPRAICNKCGSKDTTPITFVTHSCSLNRLEYIFTTLL